MAAGRRRPGRAWRPSRRAAADGTSWLFVLNHPTVMVPVTQPGRPRHPACRSTAGRRGRRWQRRGAGGRERTRPPAAGADPGAGHRSNGGARVSDLVDLLGVSDMTSAGTSGRAGPAWPVRRVHGGRRAVGARARTSRASRRSPAADLGEGRASPPRGFSSSSPATRSAVGRHHDLPVALELPGECPELTVVTNSVPVAEVCNAGGDDLTSCSPAACARRPTRWSGRSPCRAADPARRLAVPRRARRGASRGSPRPTWSRPRPTGR